MADEQSSAEEWRPVVSYEGLYEVSNLGRVRSFERNGTFGGILTLQVKGRYPRVGLHDHPRHEMALVHRLVLLAFVGQPPHGHQTAHLNGIRTDNRIENLAWVTPRENNSHKVAHGTAQRGERNPKAKLTNDAVRAIRHRYNLGEGTMRLSREYGVTKDTIWRIMTGESWSHLP